MAMHNDWVVRSRAALAPSHVRCDRRGLHRL